MSTLNKLFCATSRDKVPEQKEEVLLFSVALQTTRTNKLNVFLFGQSFMEQLVHMVFEKKVPILADEGFLTISPTISSFHSGRYRHPKEATSKSKCKRDQLHLIPRFEHPSPTFILVIQYQ